MSNSKTHNELEFFKEGLDAILNVHLITHARYEQIIDSDSSDLSLLEFAYRNGILFNKV